jgi:hypothetical protein
MRAALFLVAAAGTLAAGMAVPAAAQGDRIARVIVYGNDPCPRGAGGEDIVVCARKPETERYRIPKELRDAPDHSPSRESWANRAVDLEYAGQSGIQSCSPVGSGGASGCYAKMVAAARAERRQAAADAARVPQ